MSFDEGEELPTVDADDGLTKEERAENSERIGEFLERINQLSESVVSELTKELGIDLSAKGSDGEAAQELIEENFENRLTRNEGFHELVQDILEAVRSRFDLIEAGTLQRRRSSWPELWLFQVG